MTPKRNIARRLEELEQGGDASPPELFVGWAEHAGVDDEALASE